MKRIRLSTLMLLVVIAALATRLSCRIGGPRSGEAELRAQTAKAYADMLNQW